MTLSGCPSPSVGLPSLCWSQWLIRCCDPDSPSFLREQSPWLPCLFSDQDGCTCAFTTKTGHGSIKRYPNRSPRCQLSWWSRSIISARIVVPFFASWSLGRKSVKCPGSSNSSMILLLCSLGEGFPFWEPEPLNPQSPELQGWEAQSLSVRHWESCYTKPFLFPSLGSWTNIFNLWGTHYRKVANSKHILCPGGWHPILAR